MSMEPKLYWGGGDYNGWRFTLEPQTAGEHFAETGHHVGHAERPGYRLKTIDYAFQTLLYHKRCAEDADKKGNHDLARRIREQIATPPVEWREERWLTEWTKARLIREAKAP